MNKNTYKTIKAIIVGVVDVKKNKRIVEGWGVGIRILASYSPDMTDWTQSSAEDLTLGAVLGPEDLYRFYKSGKIEKLIVPPTYSRFYFHKLIHALHYMDVNKEDIIVPPIEAFVKPNCKYKIDEVLTPWYRAEMLEYIEIPVTDMCNLNCRNCSRFAPLVKEATFPFEENMKAMNQLHRYIKHIGTIRLMGGEPLLDKNLSSYLTACRKLYKYSEISIVTNGILLDKRLDELKKDVLDNDISFVISMYPPFYNHIHKVMERLDKEKIRYSVYNGEIFAKILKPNAKDDKYWKRRNCKVMCYAIRKGHLFHCGPASMVELFENRFHAGIKVEKGLDIFDSHLTTKKIHTYLDAPVSLCEKCDMESMELWKRIDKEPSKEDW